MVLVLCLTSVRLRLPVRHASLRRSCVSRRRPGCRVVLWRTSRLLPRLRRLLVDLRLAALRLLRRMVLRVLRILRRS